MPIDQILSMLIEERDKLNRAIEVLQGPPGSGRPRKNATATIAAAPSPNHKKGATWTPEMKAKARRRAKLLWARRMKQAKKG